MKANHPFHKRGLNVLDENGQEGCVTCGRPRRDHTLVTDRDDDRLGYGVDTEPVPQHEAYLVLSDGERAKGFVRPLRQAYKHVGGRACGTVTRMGLALCETYARNPKFYGATYCVGCRMHLPVGEFVWDEDGAVVGS